VHGVEFKISQMKKMIRFMIGVIKKHKTSPSLFSLALSEGVKDVAKEMGFRQVHSENPDKTTDDFLDDKKIN
jgi:hypothetical protein